MVTLPYCVEDMRKMASRKLPRFVFDFIEGGAGEEVTLRRNVEAFRDLAIVPRIGESRSAEHTCDLFGTTYAAPFGIAPLGLTSLVIPKADMIIAQAAMKANIPYICSAASDVAIEDIIAETGQAPWFQLYSPKNTSVAEAILERLIAAEVPVLVITIDVPVPGQRLRDLRNGLRIPLGRDLGLLRDAALHPKWAVRRLLGGKIRFPNFDQHVTVGNGEFHEIMAAQTGGPLGWDALARLRDRWPRAIVLKGILRPEDALRAIQLGFDGIIVSNHGGRQLDAAPAAITVLPSIRSAVGKSLVMIDSGVRNGSDVIRAGECGADFVWLGRPVLYALGALGHKGPPCLLQIIRNEISNVLSLAGYESWNELRNSSFAAA